LQFSDLCLSFPNFSHQIDLHKPEFFFSYFPWSTTTTSCTVKV